MDRIAPSANLERKIVEVLAAGIADTDQLAEIGRLGAQLVLQRSVEEEVTAFLRRALGGGKDDPLDVARACFEWVRDEVRHCVDFELDALTCAAVGCGGTNVAGAFAG